MVGEGRFETPAGSRHFGGAGPSQRAISAATALRIGIGLIWALNLLFIADPANAFFPTFSSSARSYAATTLGGPSIPSFVADHAPEFALLTAGLTAYLAVAFLLGLTTRVACYLGFVFNVLLLMTQFGQVVVVPGGTDVGPQPLYLLIYATLLVAGPVDRWSLDAWVRGRVEGRRTTPAGPKLWPPYPAR